MPIRKTKKGKIESDTIYSVDEFLFDIKEIIKGWQVQKDSFDRPWFRGHSDASWKLLPSVMREESSNGSKGIYNEFHLTTDFRNRSFMLGQTPDRKGCIDLWLYIMQHHGLPTRLLDWTESALIAVYFAVFGAYESTKEVSPCVWMLHPYKLNEQTYFYSCEVKNNGIIENMAIPKEYFDKGLIKKPRNNNPEKLSDIPNTWTKGKIAFDNFQMAVMPVSDMKDYVDINLYPSIYPIAIHPNYNSTRILCQRGYFTIHGIEKKPLDAVLSSVDNIKDNNYLVKYIFTEDKKIQRQILDELRLMGIAHSTIFPDFDGLAKELKFLHFKEKST